MRIRKILASAMTGAMLLTATPVITTTFDINNISTVEAAKGGAKLSIPSSSKPNLNKPASNSTKTPAASSNESKSVSGGGKEYAPSKSAKDLPNNSPAAKAGNAAANTSSSGFGNVMRNIGLFAGGMMLGSLIGSLFGGFGGGFLGDVLGFLFNVAMIYAAYKGISYLWNRFRSNRNQVKNNVQDYQPIDITPPQAQNYSNSNHYPSNINSPNQLTIGMDYDPKRTADYYRSL